MFQRLRSFFRSEPLKNTGSLARDLLASERTFLSWSRAGLGFIGLGMCDKHLVQSLVISSMSKQHLRYTLTNTLFGTTGVALEKVEAFAAISPTLLHLENSRTKLAAGILVASGSYFVAHGTLRYYRTLKDLQNGLFRPNLPGVSLFAATSIGIAFAGTLLVLENDGGKEKVKIGQDEKKDRS